MDSNNNISLPDSGSRGISPEMVPITHLSPTELYGRDDLIGLPRLQTRPVSSQSKVESTLNTPEPGYIEDLDSEVSPVRIETDLNNNRGVKRKLVTDSDNAVEDPVPYSPTDNPFQPVSAAVSCLLSSETFSFSDPLLCGETIGNQISNAHTEQQDFPRVSSQSFLGSASRRLDFRTPIDLSIRNEFRSQGEFNQFSDINRQLTDHQKVLSFVSNQSCLPLNITRPLPVIPPSSACCGYDTQQVSMNYNSWSMPVHFSQCNFVPVNRNQLNPTQTHPYSEPPKYQSENQHAFYGDLNPFPTHQFWNISSEILQSSNYAYRPGLFDMNLTQSTNNIHENMHETLPAETPLFTARACSLTECRNKETDDSDIVTAIDAANNNLQGTFEDNLDENAQETGSEEEIIVVIPDENNFVVKKSEGNINSDQFEVGEEQSTDMNANILTVASEMCRNNHLEEEQEPPQPGANTVTNSDTPDPSDRIDTDYSSTCMDMKSRLKNAKVPMCANSKKIMVPISDLGNKTVKQLLLDSAQSSGTEEQESSSDQSSLQFTEVFKERFIQERKAKSPLSAFCAALDEPKKTKIQAILPAEPRIPIPALLGPNEVPMMYSGSMLVPYFNPSLIAQSSLDASTTITHGADVSGVPIIQNSQNTNSNFVRRCSMIQPTFGGQVMRPSSAVPTFGGQVMPPSLTVPTFGGPIVPPSLAVPTFGGPVVPPSLAVPTFGGPVIPPSVAVPLYSNPVYPFNYTKSPASTVPTSRLPRILSKPPSSNSERETTHKFDTSSSGIKPHTATSSSCLGNGSILTKETWSGMQGSSHQSKRSWKARHYSFTVLRIGSYKYTCDLQNLDKAARVKFLFSKRKLVYEYQIDGSDDHIDTRKAMAEVNIPFGTIISFNLDDQELKLEVDTPPKMYEGVRSLEKSQRGIAQTTVYDRSKTVDLTFGQLEQCPYHLLHFKMCTAKIRSEMEQFDARFGNMLQRSFVMVPSKSLQDTNVAIDSYLLHPDRLSRVASPADTTSRRCPLTSLTGSPLQGLSVQGSSSHCDCTDGCSAACCSCCAVGKMCGRGSCTCVSCRNPVNILQNLGLPADKVTSDPCMMDNIYQISNLRDYVKIPLKLECCQGSTLLFSCIPGEVACPNPVCDTWYKYSWCSAQLCDESVSPRNHCRKCRRCSDHRNRHCETCNICYFAGEHGSFKCALCHGYDSQVDSSTDSGTC